MKKYFLKFLYTYRYCFLADFIFLLCFVTSFEIEGYVSEGGFKVADVFMLLVIPLYSIFYGVLTNRYIKKIFIPNLILFVIVWIGVPIFNLRFHPRDVFSLQAVIWPCIMMVFSIISSFFVSYLRSIKSKDD